MGMHPQVTRKRECFPAQSAAHGNLVLVVRHVTRHHLLPENRSKKIWRRMLALWSLIKKLSDWPPNYHKTATVFPKSSSPPHSMNKLTQNEPEKNYFSKKEESGFRLKCAANVTTSGTINRHWIPLVTSEDTNIFSFEDEKSYTLKFQVFIRILNLLASFLRAIFKCLSWEQNICYQKQLVCSLNL